MGVSLVWAAISLSLGFLCYMLPAFLAGVLPPEMRKTLADKYGWLAISAFGRPRLRRKSLGGYTMVSAEYDSEKQGDEVNVGEKGHVRDYDDLLGRLYNKTFGVIYDGTTMIIDARLAELAHWHHKHIDDAVTDRGGTPRVNPYFEVPKEWRISDPRDAMYLMSGDADPDDANTAEDFTEMALSKYRNKFGPTEMIATVIAFLAAFGAVIFADKYVLDSGGGSTPTNPLPPMGGGVILPPVDVMPLVSFAGDLLVVIL